VVNTHASALATLPSALACKKIVKLTLRGEWTFDIPIRYSVIITRIRKPCYRKETALCRVILPTFNCYSVGHFADINT